MKNHPPTTCCNYVAPGYHSHPVQWNPYNGVVQCHNCGHVYEPSPAPTEKGSPVGSETSEPETPQPEKEVDLSDTPGVGEPIMTEAEAETARAQWLRKKAQEPEADCKPFPHPHPVLSTEIWVRKSPTADTRTCDPTTVDVDTLDHSSRQHIADVQMALGFFGEYLRSASREHDWDKLEFLEWFHDDFCTGFKQTGWWDNHRRIHRHHLAQADGIPADVNLLDVLEYIADCVMAGMARSGSVYDLTVREGLLEKAFANTVDLLKNRVKLVQP